jgi:hypothetical protein
MKDRFFNFIKDLNGSSYLEYYITYLISPVVTGVKPSSLIAIGNDSKALLDLWRSEGQKLLASLSLKTITLRRLDEKDIVLIYNEKNLHKVLSLNANEAFLKKLGYSDINDLNNTLYHLYDRYNKFHCPHEIGIFLGIPLSDVEAFMNCADKNCLLCGYWKVYSNEEDARELFKMYDLSKELVMKYSLENRKINWIAETLSNSLSCVIP